MRVVELYSGRVSCISYLAECQWIGPTLCIIYRQYELHVRSFDLSCYYNNCLRRVFSGEGIRQCLSYLKKCCWSFVKLLLLLSLRCKVYLSCLLVVVCCVSLGANHSLSQCEFIWKAKHQRPELESTKTKKFQSVVIYQMNGFLVDAN